MVKPQTQYDPWGQVEDLDGTALYALLDLAPRATTDDIKSSYRVLARKHHPDKGGDPNNFARLQHAYEVLVDPKRRQVYDTWAKELQFRYVRPSNRKPLGGEDILLNELDNLGLSCDPMTQLVVTCEVCRRPATKECWTCGMKICEFCTLKRHWKDGVPLHWPLINSNHMEERLARRELEKKRIDDAKRLALENPNYRSERELQDIRAFKDAAQELLQLPSMQRQSTYDLRLARFYMWAQTDSTVYIACRIPTGYEDRELVVECTGRTLLIQSEDSPALIDRRLAGCVDSSRPIETMRTNDNRICAVSLPKGEFGKHWDKLFLGDSDGVRALKPPYEMFETESEAIVQCIVPFWIDPEDIKVDITENHIVVLVRNALELKRTYWRNSEEEAKRRDYRVVDVEECSWVLEEDMDDDGERCKMLTVTLVRPEPTEEEVQYKKGKRQDNRAALRVGSMNERGWRFFADDEDEYDLEEVLQALCFKEVEKVYVPPKPWLAGAEPYWAKRKEELPAAARGLLIKLLDAEPESSTDVQYC